MSVERKETDQQTSSKHSRTKSGNDDRHNASVHAIQQKTVDLNQDENFMRLGYDSRIS